MSQKERDRLRILSWVKEGQIKIKKAAEILELSYRHCRRIYKRYREEGEKGLIHRSRGRPSNRKKDPLFRKAVISRYEERYKGFGPTLACEKLEKEGYVLDHETLRRWLIVEGNWEKRRKRKKHRNWRERKKHFGELVQVDGSHHAWFEDRGGKSVLINMVDDATGTTFCLLDEGETTRAVMLTIWEYIIRYGIPRAIYVDRDSIYITTRPATISEELKGERPLTQLGRALQKLGVKIITARSPQAKGRVERSNGIHQDRLVKELRLEDIDNLKEANTFIEDKYLADLNGRFAIEPKDEVDFHRKVENELDLGRIFCFEKDRIVDNDWTVRWNRRVFQIVKDNKILPRARAKVVVQEWLDGTIHIVYRGEELRHKEIYKKPLRKKKKANISAADKVHIPAADHPWRKWTYKQRITA